MSVKLVIEFSLVKTSADVSRAFARRAERRTRGLTRVLRLVPTLGVVACAVTGGADSRHYSPSVPQWTDAIHAVADLIVLLGGDPAAYLFSPSSGLVVSPRLIAVAALMRAFMSTFETATMVSAP
jgi:hypothetical protein